jgi:hypothetical protein
MMPPEEGLGIYALNCFSTEFISRYKTEACMSRLEELQKKSLEAHEELQKARFARDRMLKMYESTWDNRYSCGERALEAVYANSQAAQEKCKYAEQKCAEIMELLRLEMGESPK